MKMLQFSASSLAFLFQVETVATHLRNDERLMAGRRLSAEHPPPPPGRMGCGPLGHFTASTLSARQVDHVMHPNGVKSQSATGLTGVLHRSGYLQCELMSISDCGLCR